MSTGAESALHGVQGFQGPHHVQGFHGARPGDPTYRFEAEKSGGWKFVHFNGLKSKVQEFGLNKAVWLIISPFTGPRSTATLLRAITETQ